MPASAGRVSLTALLTCFSLLTDKPSWVFLLHCSHPSFCKRSIRDGLQGRSCVSVGRMLQLGAVDWQTQHCWWHRELRDPGTLPRDPHTFNARPWDQPSEEGVAVSLYVVLVRRGERLNCSTVRCILI